jgi:hypothetical protein
MVIEAVPVSWEPPPAPPFVLRAAVPRTVVPSRKVTVPVGVGTVAETVAVKVTVLLVTCAPAVCESTVLVGSLPMT